MDDQSKPDIGATHSLSTNDFNPKARWAIGPVEKPVDLDERSFKLGFAAACIKGEDGYGGDADMAWSDRVTLLK